MTTSNPIRDPILDARFKAFKREHLGDNRRDDEAFEHYVNYSVLASEMTTNEAVTPERVRMNVHTGGPGDRALDGAALFVQRKLATTTSDVDKVVNLVGEEHSSIDADFYFIQTTTAHSFDNAKVLKFLHGVKDFLSAEPEDREEFTGKARELWDVKSYLLREKGNVLKRRPTLHLYYAYTGDWRMRFTDEKWWQKDTNLEASVRKMLRDISQSHPSFRFDVIDANRLLQIHEDLHERRVMAKGVDFRHRVSVPGDGRATYIGIMNCQEYIKKIAVYPDDTLTLNENLFIDNVRLHLGDTPVNKGIATSLQDETKKNEFMLLNNGITIVARRARVLEGEDHCTIYNYQIVNGCQTTHVLHENYEHLTDKTFVPVKLVVTEDEDLIDAIVEATNTQNQVSPDQFWARDPMQRALEVYYKAQNENGRGYRELTYQRQTAAYGESRYEGSAVIDPTTQLMCYEAMFDQLPHVAANRKSTPSNEAYTSIFNPDKNPLQAFHVAGYALCEMESFIKEHYSSSSKIDEPLNYKYHLLLLFKITQQGEEWPPRSNRVERYCDKLRGILSDQDKREAAFRDAVSILEEGLAWYSDNQTPHTARSLTNKLIELANSRTDTAGESRQPSRANRYARSVTAPQTSSAPATNNATAGNVPQQTPAAHPPSHPAPDSQNQVPAPRPSQTGRRIQSDDNVLTGTITAFVKPPSKRSKWLVRVSTSDGKTKEYEIAKRDVGKFPQLNRNNAVGKMIRFIELKGSGSGPIPRAQIRGVP